MKLGIDILVPLSWLIFWTFRLRYPGTIELADGWKVRLRHSGTVELADLLNLGFAILASLSWQFFGKLGLDILVPLS